MKKFEVGDTVVIRDDLDVVSWYGTNDCVEEMVELGGRQAQITEVVKFDKKTEYRIDLDEGDWAWTPEMFQ